MYPLHTQDTMRNLADHLFDSSTGYAIGELSPRVHADCDLIATGYAIGELSPRVHADCDLIATRLRSECCLILAGPAVHASAH
jgi:hypothetical protein